jgi:hypothetical protein
MQLHRIHARQVRAAMLAALIWLAWACSPTAPIKPPQDNAALLREKLDALAENGAKSPVPPKTVAFSEEELNLFLVDHLKENAPKAISDPQISILSNAQIAARVLVDVDEFKRQRKRNSGPLNFFSGQVPVIVRGDLTGRDGQGQFKLRSAEINGFSLPRALALDLLTNHTRSKNYPNGFDIEKPFDLPYNIRELAVRDRELWVVQ